MSYFHFIYLLSYFILYTRYFNFTSYLHVNFRYASSFIPIVFYPLSLIALLIPIPYSHFIPAVFYFNKILSFVSYLLYPLLRLYSYFQNSGTSGWPARKTHVTFLKIPEIEPAGLKHSCNMYFSFEIREIWPAG